MRSESKLKIFVSYRSDDSGWAANSVYSFLFASLGPERIFFDSRSIRLGETWEPTILNWIQDCDVVLAIIGRNWARPWEVALGAGETDLDDFVFKEIHSAVQSRIRIVPVLVDDAEMPPPTSVPPEIQPILHTQAVSVRLRTADADCIHLLTRLDLPDLKRGYGIRIRTTNVSASQELGRAVMSKSRELRSRQGHVRWEGAIPGALAQVLGPEANAVPLTERFRESSASGTLEEFARTSLWNSIGEHGPEAECATDYIRRAEVGRTFGIQPSLVDKIRRHRNNPDAIEALQDRVRGEAAYRLVDIVRRFHYDNLDNQSDLTFLAELSQSQDDDAVRSFATLRLSDEMNRRGHASHALRLLRAWEVRRTPEKDRPNQLLQLLNLSYSLVSSTDAANPSAWGIDDIIKALCSEFGDELGFRVDSSGRIMETDFSEPQVRRLSDLWTGNYPHLLFFLHHYQCADSAVSQSERRQVWDAHLRQCRMMLDPRVVQIDHTYQVWNHLFLLAIHAHRVADFDYRDKFLRYAVGLDGFWRDSTKIDEHLLKRKTNFNPQYIFFAILVETVRQQDSAGRLQFLQTFETDIKFMIERINRIQTMAARRAVDAFAKRAGFECGPVECLGIYGAEVDAHDVYVLDVPCATDTKSDK